MNGVVDAPILKWRNGVVVAYGASGIAFSSWVSRLPAIRDALELTPATIGLLLLCMTAGSFLSVSASGLIVIRLGSKRTIQLGSTIVGVGLALTGLATTVFDSSVLAGIALAIVGLGTASWNTASNVEGASVERALGRHIMPRLHGSFSLGTVLGAGVGAWAAAVHLPVFYHLLAAGIVVAVSVNIGAKYFLADKTPVVPLSVETGPIQTLTPDLVAVDRDLLDHAAGGSAGGTAAGAADVRSANSAPLDSRRLVAQAWRDKRTLLLGVLVLGLALAEGAAGDWVALALADGYGESNANGAMGYGLFVTSMTIGRFAGTYLLDKFGRVPVLRVSAAMALIGLALFVFAPFTWLAYVALIFWGLGSSLGFPVGMSAAADDPSKAAARVSVVSTIGYGAFLCGPPVLGLLAEHVGILHSLLAVLVMLVLTYFLAPVARKQEVTGR